MNGSNPRPNTSRHTLQNTSDAAQPIRISFLKFHVRTPSRFIRAASSRHAERNDPTTERGTNFHSDSPSRADAGSSGVATLM